MTEGEVFPSLFFCKGSDFVSVIIESVEKHSPADKAGVKSGYTLLSINGNEIMDVLDYRFYQSNQKLVLSLIKITAPEISPAPIIGKAIDASMSECSIG